MDLLRENAEATVTCKSVAGAPLLEERAVIPPTLVGTVHVQEVFVLGELKLNPSTVSVALSMPLCEGCNGRILLVIDVEPARRFGNEPDEEANDQGTGHLNPDRYEPG